MAETRTGPHGLAFAPTKIGVLIDLDMGTKDDFLACLRFAFDEALRAAASSLRPVELVVKEAIGLPRLEASNTHRRLPLAGRSRACSARSDRSSPTTRSRSRR